MKNLNEQINRMKSLMSEDRLFGNLVDKKPINEWGKAAKLLGVGDDVFKVGVKNSDEAVDVINKAIKYFDDANIAVRYSDEMIKSVDDIATDFVKPINSSTELISHYKKYEPIYKYLYKDAPNKLKNYESYLKALESGTVTDLTIMVKGKPLFSYLPEGVNMISLKNYLNELPEEVAKKRIKHIQKSYRDYFKGKYMEVLDTGDDIGSSVGKGGDDVVEVTGKNGDELNDAIDDVVTKTEKGDNISININVNSGGGKSGDDAVEGVVTSKTGDEIVDETTEELVDGMGDGAKESLKKGDYWNRYWAWVNKSKWRRNLINPLTIKETMPDYMGTGIAPLYRRTWRITSRSLPTWYIISYMSGGWIPGPLTSASNLYEVIANSGLGKWIAKMLGEDACNALYNTTDGIVDCKTIAYEVEKVILENAKKVDCKVLLQKSDEEILNDLYGDDAIEKELRVLVKKKYEEKKGSVIAYDVLDSYMKEIKLSLDTIKSTDDELEKKLTKEISNQRDLCVHDKVKKEALKSGYEIDEMKSSDDNQKPGGGGSQGTELPQF
jgi:hypothetical protein